MVGMGLDASHVPGRKTPRMTYVENSSNQRCGNRKKRIENLKQLPLKCKKAGYDGKTPSGATN